MQSFANSSDAASQPPPSAEANNAASKPTGPPAKPPGTADVKPRLTKEQHDILERHFQVHHKPSTSTKKGFAESLGVPLDKINNWFQNRRAKVKQDFKKQMNQQNMMQQGMYPQPQMPGAPQMPLHVPVTMGHFAPHMEQVQPQLSVTQGYYNVTSDVSPGTLPVPCIEGPPALDIGPGQPQMMAHPQYEIHHSLRSIPEADRGTSYHPNAVMQHLMAASAGASYMQNSPVPMQLQHQGQNFVFDRDTQNGLPNDPPYSMPPDLNPVNDALEDDQYGLYPEYISYLPLITNAPNDIQVTTSSMSAVDSPFSGAQSSGTNPSSIEAPNAGSVASLASKYSGWTDTNGEADTKQDNEPEDFFSYSLPQASASDANFIFPNTQSQSFSRLDMYQHSNASAHAVLSSPHQSGRSVSTGPADFETPNFGDDVFARRNSSTSNLATNIEAIHIQNTTPEGFKSPTQSSIAARRQKRPTALNSNTLRSASYSGSLPSPGNNGDHTLRRIRSSGIGNAGRVQKPQPSSAQRSPMSLSFSDAASSPKFHRTLSSSSITTVGHGGSLAPPTPQTPNERPFPSWQSNTVYRNHPSIPDHSSPESFGGTWSLEGTGGAYLNSESPPSLEVAQLHQARLGNDVYRDTPPQSAPATQQGFPNHNLMQPPKMRAGFHSSTDLTLQHPKPSHFRRPSLPVEAQGQGDDSNGLFAPSYGGMKLEDFNDFALSSIQHNVPFAPPVSAMPDFLVNQYVPPGDFQGHMRRTTAPEAKSYIFANQGPRDFRS
ncbi:hypothetical protein BU23DRAFT_41295 [Bimuria novae-zelandiae CBS 107.79]|uniref:Homeobox domain-containing protein n=1 Tax=Bimuria novae-zelandiae CBS 107.79 TaxID=1447943 RepID=A0A6A5ULW1_9PLEO|nr:hypothetical protein BU23DRAFT_41295 [Bimuria novae-zelandiae CBS 107.79]